MPQTRTLDVFGSIWAGLSPDSGQLVKLTEIIKNVENRRATGTMADTVNTVIGFKL